MKYQPPSVTVFPWLKANLGTRALAPLTGSDTRALRAAVEIIEQYSYDADESLIAAFGIVVTRMQAHTRGLAYHAIAHVMDWHNRSEIWVRAGLPEFVPSRCEHEPREALR